MTRRRAPQLLACVALFLLLAVFAAGVRALPAEPLADLNTGARLGIGSDPRSYVRINDASGVFVATDAVSGRELWHTDGTAAGTVLLADICPGLCSSGATDLVRLGGSVYFSADDGQHGIEPWRLDIASMTVHLVADVDPGAGSSRPASFLQSSMSGSSRVYFHARTFDFSHHDIYVTDGTPQGTVGTLGDSMEAINPLGEAGEQVYFGGRARQGNIGTELYRLTFSSGDYSAVLVEDINAGPASSSLRRFTQNGTRMFFTADDGTHGRELWVQNLTSGSTTLVMDIDPGADSANPTELTAFGGKLYFVAGASQADRELWSSDGTQAGTARVRDIAPGAVGSAPELLRVVNGLLVFLADDGSSGRELWRSDGTSDGTVRIKDQFAGAGNGFEPFLSHAADAGGFYVFANGNQLWSTDGSAASVRTVGTPFDAPVSAITSGGRFLFVGAEQRATGDEPFVHVPGSGLVALLRNIGDEVGHSDPFGFVPIAARTAFLAADGRVGIEPYGSTGLPAPVTLLGDTRPQSLLSNARENSGLVAAGPRLFFVPSINELWATDGTASGTGLVHAFDDGFIDCHLGDGDDLFFILRSAGVNSNNQLWRSDGTAAGTVALMDDPLLDLRADCSGDDRSIAVVGDAVYFVARDEAQTFGFELYRSHRLLGGAELVRDIRSGAVSSIPNSLTTLGESLFFVADGGEGVELWKSNGTAQGTVLVRDVHPQGSSNPTALRVLGERLLFTASDGSSGRELYASDGTGAGTARVRDLFAGPGSAFGVFPQLTVSGSTLYFAATESTDLGVHLYRTDVTTGGTRRLTFGLRGVAPQDLAAAGLGWLMFSAATAQEGRELWISDGSAAGTFLLEDIAPGPASSSPRQLALSGGHVYFSADDGSIGREPWVVPAASETVFADSFE